MPSVFANGRSIIHAGDGLTHVAAPPDVCKTPSPGGPVPIPYVNLASDADLAKGTKGVKIESNPIALASSYLSTSTGDEPGTAGGGIISSKTKGKMGWGTTSPDVRFEGKSVARFMDITRHNGNSYNDAFKSMGGTGLAYGDDFVVPCRICKKGPRQHRVLETKECFKICKSIVDDLTGIYKSGGAKKKTVVRSNGSTYMVGVMICKCKKVFAATSGYTPPGFEAVATGQGVDEVIIVKDPATGHQRSAIDWRDMVAANMSDTSARGKNIAIREAWDDVLEQKKNVGKGYNPPGTCAAAKLVTCGHAPVALSEMIFWPKIQWPEQFEVLTTERQGLLRRLFWREKILQNKHAKKQWRSHDNLAPESGVASCHSCQQLLFLTNCPKRTC